MNENSRQQNIPDVSNWHGDDFAQATGVRRKFWLMHPDDDSHFLFKVPRDNTGEAWGEQIASTLGQRLGFEVAHTRIAAYNGQTGSLSKNFTVPWEEFFEGGDVLNLFNSDFNRWHLTGYDIDDILLALNEVGLHQDFLAIPVFDALIANQDRHCDNWGVIRNADGVHRLAPLYDNGCALGHLIHEVDLDVYLRDAERMAGFVRRGKSMIGQPGKRHPKFLTLLSYIQTTQKHALSHWFECVASMSDQDVHDAVNDIPDMLMSEKRKEFVCKLLSHRQTWLLDWWKEQT